MKERNGDTEQRKKIKSETKNILQVLHYPRLSFVWVVFHSPGINSSNNVECLNFMSLWSEEQNGELHEMKMREGEEQGMIEEEKRDEDEEQRHMGRGTDEVCVLVK